MSEQQIMRILEKLDAQDREVDKRFSAIEAKLEELEPVKRAFDNVMGFDRISMWALKALAALGVAIGMVYTFITWIRQ